MPEIKQIIARIIEWTKLKCRIEHNNGKKIYFHEREIWWSHLGQNIGSEQHGKNQKFDRPVLILKKFNAKLLLVLPMTTSEKDGIYYYKTAHKVGQKQASAVLSQLRSISSKRLIRKQRTLPKDEFEEIRNEIRDLI
jgi:mRNA interferase MazF